MPNTEITRRKYYVLVIWLIEVAPMMKLRLKTLVACLDMLDRYFAHYRVTQDDEIQLIGITMLLIAFAVVEESETALAGIRRISDNAYTADQIRTKELVIIRQLNYACCM